MLLGVCLLGALDGQEADFVRAHNGSCARCRAEHARLARIPPMLELLREEEAAEEL
jgi:hypothetical protein